MANRSKKKIRPAEVSPAKTAKTKEILPGKSSSVPWAIILRTLVIAAAVLWIYWPALRGDWLWDDDWYITGNPLLREPDRLWKAWFDPGSFLEYYPLQETVQWVQWQLWGVDTLGYHLTNVLLHILGALLVWRLLTKFHLRLAWLGGLIFAIHPVQVESVAWIVELKNTLSLPPFLLAMCTWIDFEEKGRKVDYLLAVGLFLVAMLCKITMAMFPVVILLYAWWLRGRIGWRDAMTSAPFWLISLILGATAIWVGQDYFHHNNTGQNIVAQGGIFSRFACAGLSIAFYFSRCFLPMDLMPIYPRWVVDPPSPLQFLPWLVLSGVTYWLLTKRHGWGRHALLGLGFFLILLVPFLGFKTISYMNYTWVMDHFLYIPIIGLIGLVVAALGQMKTQLTASFRFYSTGLLFIALAFLAFQSRSYAKMFINQETLWTYELQHNPEAWLAHNNLGGALFQTGRVADAIEQFEQTLRINPDYAEAHNNLGYALLQTGRVSEAIEQYQQSLRLEPANIVVHINLGNAFLQKGLVDEAIEQFQQALKINPNYADAHSNLGIAFAKKGRLDEAIFQLQEALRLKPDFGNTQENLAKVQALARRNSTQK